MKQRLKWQEWKRKVLSWKKSLPSSFSISEQPLSCRKEHIFWIGLIIASLPSKSDFFPSSTFALFPPGHETTSQVTRAYSIYVWVQLCKGHGTKNFKGTKKAERSLWFNNQGCVAVLLLPPSLLLAPRPRLRVEWLTSRQCGTAWNASLCYLTLVAFQKLFYVIGFVWF